MARRVRTFWRKLPRDTHDALAKSGRGKWKSTTAWRKLGEYDVTVVTPISQIRAMAAKASRRSGRLIKISAKPFEKHHTHADGLTVRENGRIKIYLHPVLQYYDKGYVQDVIDHELDHGEVFAR